MPRFSSHLFNELALMMIGFGLLIGLTFPFLAMLIGLPAEQTLTPRFWMATSAAGLLAGAINFVVSRWVVRPRLLLLAERMSYVERSIHTATYTGDWSGCTPEGCRVPVTSRDELGDCAQAFNDLVTALFRSHDTNQAVSAFSTTLSSELELGSLADKALALCIEHTGADAGALLAAPSGELSLLAHRGLRDPHRLAKSGHLNSVLRSGRCEKVDLPEDVVVEALVTEFRPREVLLVPALFNDNPVGVVVLASSRAFARDKEWLVDLFRQGLGLALNNALVHDQLQRTAAVDPLTGALNRRFGLTRLREEFKRAVRGGSSLGVMMIDVDHFKTVNDTHGHLAGDRILTRVVDLVTAALREGDVMVRYGGEEFLVILPGADRNGAALLAERVRQRVANAAFAIGSEAIRVTVSIGVAAFPDQPVAHPRELVEEADRALYAAKNGGRDRVTLAG